MRYGEATIVVHIADKFEKIAKRSISTVRGMEALMVKMIDVGPSEGGPGFSPDKRLA